MQTLKDLQTHIYQAKGFEKTLKGIQSSQHKQIYLKGFSGSLPAFLVAQMYQMDISPIVCVLPTYDASSYLFSDLSQIMGAKAEEDLMFLTTTDQKPYDIEQVADNIRYMQRAETLQRIKDNFKGILVMSSDALIEKVPSETALKQSSINISTGESLEQEQLIEHLLEQGFEMVTHVSQHGEIARRGGIIDVFSFTSSYPFRIEFFGDEIDTIREFDPNTQRSISRITQARLVPNIERQKQQADNNLQYAPILSYLPKDCWLVLEDKQLLLEQIDTQFHKVEHIYENLVHDNPAIPEPSYRYMSREETSAVFKTHPQILYGSFSGDNPQATLFGINGRPQPDFNSKINLLKKTIQGNEKRGLHTVILSDSRGQELRLRELLVPELTRISDGQDDLEEEYYEPKHLSFIQSPLHEGFELLEMGVAVYTDHQIFNRYFRPTVRKQKQKYGGFSLRELLNLTPGDFVTHIDYGIGKYAGLQKIEVRGKQQEAVKLIFKDEDVLYVNVNSLYKLHRYTGKEGHQPKLTKLGTAEWEKIKTSTKKRVKDIARDLIKLYAARQQSKGFAFSNDSVWQKELAANFAYEDTPDQAKSWEDVREDMQKAIPMDRLVCGDVGFGKTEIAVRAAFKAVQDGKQVAILVPTTILAAQHFKTFSERLAPFPVTVEMMSRFRTDTEQKETLKQLKEGKLDIVIGTHRIASKKMEIPRLGLLIIDEEQRFGVAVKERLRQLRANVDTLTLTATPIPRTLQFSLMGARDLSYINTPPPNRQPIQTEIHTFDKNLIRDAIIYEVGRGGQVFFIHNRVQSIEEMATTLRQLVPNVRFQTGHGQMDSDSLEKVMMDFMQHKFDVLVSSNIVESGLDIPNANTMIINHAERFGLSELHQLRGRVGRSNKKAFCYLLTPSVHSLTKEAKQRLRAVEEFSDLGSGLYIAMRDLDIRGAGNLLGGEQSGFIADVGYETYHKILEEAIYELRNEEFSNMSETSGLPPLPISDTVVDIDMDAYIPENYVTDRIERLNLYRTLSEAKTPDQLEGIRLEWQDRFGRIPEEAENLLTAILIKQQIEAFRLPKVQFKNQRLFLNMPPQEDAFFYQHYFKPLLAQIAALPNRYVLKDTDGKLRIILQDVPSIEKLCQIVQNLKVPKV
jgi:transcription-repair coupling factor (superfamily II helicase)